ncbi:MAG: hypothetical protein JWN74_2422 [Acidobacteriaceae bacterium]|nr:hypothetical protein [Acidobacteriaceae bacterium]
MLKAAVFLVFGIFIGAASVEGFHIARDNQKREFFEQRLRCKKLAQDYVKASSDDYTSMSLDRADFSKSRNSCLAATLESSGKDRQFVEYKVTDVITGEVLSSDFCDERDSHSQSFCGNGRDIKLLQKRDEQLDKEVK